MTLYMKVTRDEYELPVAVAETKAELEQMTNEEIANIRGLGRRGYDEILEKLWRRNAVRTTIQGQQR